MCLRVQAAAAGEGGAPACRLVSRTTVPLASISFTWKSVYLQHRSLLSPTASASEDLAEHAAPLLEDACEAWQITGKACDANLCLCAGHHRGDAAPG